ncbi:MAG: hypothetical protein WCE48_02695 [Steroidobacteraceae bacterium]
MNVGLALEIDSSIDAMASVVTELDDTLKEFFREKIYGDDVQNLAIGVILTSPEIAHMHTVRDLKYRKRVSYKTPKMEFANVVEYDVKPNFEIFGQLSAPQARKYLAELLVDSTDVMRKHQSKFPNFDVATFTKDLRACLQV